MRTVLFGALAGLSATMAMTAAMRHLMPLLPPRHRYPLPPREIVERAARPPGEGSARTGAVLAHFGFGALVGAGFGMLPRRWRQGVPFGLAVWAASYLGWLPALDILKPAHRHPGARNLLMLAVHVVWGAALSAGLRELEMAANDAFSGGPKRDAPGRRM